MSALYPRTLLVGISIAAMLAFAFSDLRLQTWEALLPLFDWMETTLFGRIGQTWGAVFAVVEAFHLVGLALLGGSVLLADGRLLGLWFNSSDDHIVEQQAGTLFLWALALLIATGVFMACGVASKIYYLPVFWYKMLALGIGIAFYWGVRRPLLRRLDISSDATAKLVGLASIMVWFTVAATGRWMAFQDERAYV